MMHHAFLTILCYGQVSSATADRDCVTQLWNYMDLPLPHYKPSQVVYIYTKGVTDLLGVNTSQCVKLQHDSCFLFYFGLLIPATIVQNLLFY